MIGGLIGIAMRITPACAGTTSWMSPSVSTVMDHPRVCGNHHVRQVRYGFSSGSPPRVREPLAGFIKFR